MDAQLVWDTWRRLLTNDQLVEWVIQSKQSGAAPPTWLNDAEIAILADYASTPVSTDTNIGMYRRGLVRNALAGLSFVPLTHSLLYKSGLDVEAVAADFVRSTGYFDDGPNFWRIAGAFVAHLAGLREFAARLPQDVLALDAAAVALARRLGESSVAIWPQTAAAIFSDTSSRVSVESAFVANPTAVVVSSSFDLTAWIEDPDLLDTDDHLEPSTRHWLVYFPFADAALAYAELSKRSASAFDLLSIPKTAVELSLALDGLPVAEVLKVIVSLAELGVIVPEADHPSSKTKAAHLPHVIRKPAETLRAHGFGTGAAIR